MSSCGIMWGFGTSECPCKIASIPFGDIFRASARGTMMGNRGGALHDSNREIIRGFKSRRWITCVLEFRGRHRIVMSERRYTELFFLDEAVAFAAGHRPCAECRRERFNAFKEAWRRRTGKSHLPFADEMDLELHPARIDKRRKVDWQAELSSLPAGCFVRFGERAYLVRNNALLLWTPEGYSKREVRPKNIAATVLTPKPIVECFRHGYEPEIHDSGRRLCEG